MLLGERAGCWGGVPTAFLLLPRSAGSGSCQSPERHDWLDPAAVLPSRRKPPSCPISTVVRLLCGRTSRKKRPVTSRCRAGVGQGQPKAPPGRRGTRGGPAGLLCAIGSRDGSTAMLLARIHRRKPLLAFADDQIAEGREGRHRHVRLRC
jgi:hypothetical protein